MSKTLITTNDNSLGEKPGDLVTVESVTACQSVWSQTVRALPFLVLLSLILGLSVNLILVVEKKMVAEHLTGETVAFGRAR